MEKKLVTLTPEIITRLEQEKNYSALIDALLHRHYGLPLEGDSAVVRARREALDETTPAQEIKEFTPEYTAAMVDTGMSVPVNYLGRPVEDDPETAQALGFSVKPVAQTPPETPEPPTSHNVVEPDTTCPKCGQLKLTSVCFNCDL